MSGLDKLTVADAIEVQRQLFNQQEVAASLLTETTTAFAQALATRASGKPVEFFKLMKKPFYRPVFNHVREHVMSAKKGVKVLVTGKWTVSWGAKAQRKRCWS